MTAGIAPFSEERLETIRMIRDSAAAFSDVARARKLRFQGIGFDRDVFREMAELGWVGLAVPEEAGGAGLGLPEMVALAEELGRALAPEPLIAAQLSAHVLAAAGETEVLASLLAGQSVVLTAWQDRANSLDIATGADTPRRFVPMAGGATHFLWPVQEHGRVALHLLTMEEVDLTIEETQDGGHLGTVRPKPWHGHGPGRHLADDIAEALGEALDRAALATAAYLLGGMEACFALTLDYLKQRQQFGRAIGTFQVLQHKAADARVQISLARAAVEQAAEAGTPALISRAKARASEAAMLVQQACLQLHGGIGYTDDYDSGLYLRKAMVLAPAFGAAALHRRRFMALSPEMEEAA